MKNLPILLAILLLPLVTLAQSSGPAPEATSFAGKPLFTTPLAAQALAKSDSIIATFRAKKKLSDDDYVEIGKQLVSTARYKMAVEVYTEGLKKYPDSYKLLRNRGHRYITLRQLDKSIADLTRAEKLIQKDTDVMEYGVDGKPTATVRHQVWYHLGVYYYLTRDYAQAAKAFEKALETAGDLRNVAGASDWLYNCYQRIGKKKEAEELLKPFTMETDTDRENAYFRRIMFYKGLITAEQLVDIKMPPDKMSVQDVTKIYGLANLYRYKGDTAMAATLCRLILLSNAWPGFAYAGAEKDVEK